MGHSVDWNTGGEGEWFSDSDQYHDNVPGWEKDENNNWEFTSIPNVSQPVSSYAVDLNPKEDFAETFEWYIRGDAAGKTPDTGRQNALNIALYGP